MATLTSQSIEKNGLRGWIEASPLIQMVLAGAIGLTATWTTIQLTQNSQAAEIRRQGEKIERLERDSVSRELFDERTKTLLEVQKSQSDKLDRLLAK